MTQPANPPSLGEQILARFIEKNPLSAALRLVLEQLFNAAQIDALFEENCDQQYTRKITFSAIVAIMAAVVTSQVSSVHAALKRNKAAIGASIKSCYEKLNGTEPAVSSALVQHTAAKALALIHQMGAALPSPIPGFRVRILDGNHLAATERRLAVLTNVAAGPLPGFCLVAFDLAAGLMTDVIVCEDGHAQERSLTQQILALVEAGDCWIADRNFCTMPIMFGIMERSAAFIMRQHGSVIGKAAGPVIERGRGAGGTLREQLLEISLGKAKRTVRRVSLELEVPTREGTRELHFLTNLPPEIDAAIIEEIYHTRWKIEGAFGELSLWLNAELSPLGYPGAALLGFCVGIVAYNAMKVVLGAIGAAHGEKARDETSGYYISEFGRSAVGAIDDLVEPEQWRGWRTLPLIEAAALLLQLAARIDLEPLRKAKRGPKQPVPPRTRFKEKTHVSTHQLLNGKDDDS